MSESPFFVMLEGVLDDVRVIDLSRLLPGPYLTSVLVDCGADVIKIEDPTQGDYLRNMPPQVDGMCARFSAINRGKRSVVLNLKKSEGRAALRELISTADVVVEGFRPGKLDTLGVSLDSLRDDNERLITCSIIGYSRASAYRDRAGHDINYLALSGILANTTVADEIAIPGAQFGDLAGGALWALSGLFGALYAREKSGRGRHIDIAMTHGLRALALVDRAAASAGETQSPGQGFLTGGLASYSIYDTADGEKLAVGALEPKFWLAFNQAIGRTATASELLAQDQSSIRNQVAAILGSQPLSHWLEVFQEVDACVEAVLPHQQVETHASAETARTPLANGVTSTPCNHGEHTEEILRTLGLTDAAIRAASSR